MGCKMLDSIYVVFDEITDSDYGPVNSVVIQDRDGNVVARRLECMRTRQIVQDWFDGR